MGRIHKFLKVQKEESWSFAICRNVAQDLSLHVTTAKLNKCKMTGGKETKDFYPITSRSILNYGGTCFCVSKKYLNGPKILHILKVGFICIGEMDAVDTCF